MRYIAAYLLLQLGGNANPDAAAVKKLLDVVGVETDSDRLNKLLSELKGKSIDELIKEGSSKLASVGVFLWSFKVLGAPESVWDQTPLLSEHLVLNPIRKEC